MAASSFESRADEKPTVSGDADFTGSSWAVAGVPVPMLPIATPNAIRRLAALKIRLAATHLGPIDLRPPPDPHSTFISASVDVSLFLPLPGETQAADLLSAN
jgi:hypothetical protein